SAAAGPPHWARKRRPSSTARCQRSTGTNSGQRDSRTSRVRLKRLKRPKSARGCVYTTATELTAYVAFVAGPALHRAVENGEVLTHGRGPLSRTKLRPDGRPSFSFPPWRASW